MEYSPLGFQIFQKMKLMMLLIKWLVDYEIFVSFLPMVQLLISPGCLI